jgi:IclR family KDG regulon transcriptional repressor
MSINQSLAHGLNVLLLYDADHPSFTVADISQRLKYTQSKTYRIIRTLIQSEFLKESTTAGQYSLGLNALRIGLFAQRNFNVSKLARPLMEELSHLTKETVLMTAVNGTKGICLDRVESDHPIRYSIFQSGAVLPLHAGASSKILMAYLPEREWDRIIQKEGLIRFTPHTITDASKLKAHLREIRRKGYAFSDQEVDREVRAVSAPVLNVVGDLVAGLSISGPVYRIGKKSVSSLGKLMIEYAQKISSQLGNLENERLSKVGESTRRSVK